MSVFYHDSKDFYLSRKSPDQVPKLCNKLKGLSLIYFHSNNCSHCDAFDPIFQELPKKIGGCLFGCINVSNYNNIVKASKNTTTPIEYVPYIILYVKGVPFMRYDGPRELQSIQSFIFEIAGRLQNNTHQSNSQSQRHDNTNANTNNSQNSKKITTYGNSKKKEVCYLTLDDAYKSK